MQVESVKELIFLGWRAIPLVTLSLQILLILLRMYRKRSQNAAKIFVSTDLACRIIGKCCQIFTQRKIASGFFLC
jgi:hypothetical protein